MPKFPPENLVTHSHLSLRVVTRNSVTQPPSLFRSRCWCLFPGEEIKVEALACGGRVVRRVVGGLCVP